MDDRVDMRRVDPRRRRAAWRSREQDTTRWSTVTDDERTRRQIGQGVLRVVRGDITSLPVDAVVNAANEHLAHGGGVAAALSRKGGPRVQEESDAWVREHGPLGSGAAAVTTAGKLPAGALVHVVGPRHRPEQDNAGLLTAAVRAALDAADRAGASSVALPAISAGIFGYPPAEATAVIADACAAWLAEGDRHVRDVVLVGFDDATAGQFADAVEQRT
jgi:O-acetyl-ADP-ribose deacetylase (regulator of RNase III)